MLESEDRSVSAFPRRGYISERVGKSVLKKPET